MANRSGAHFVTHGPPMGATPRLGPAGGPLFGHPFFGHQHTGTSIFSIAETPAFIGGSISTYVNLNPSFVQYTYTNVVEDYTSFWFDLHNPQNGFMPIYRASTDYAVENLNISSVFDFTNRLKTNNTLADRYDFNIKRNFLLQKNDFFSPD